MSDAPARPSVHCPDECEACAGRDYVSPVVLAEAAANLALKGRDAGEEGYWPCPLGLLESYRRDVPRLREALRRLLDASKARGGCVDIDTQAAERQARAALASGEAQ